MSKLMVGKYYESSTWLGIYKEVEQNRQEGLALISKAFQDAMNAEVTR